MLKFKLVPSGRKHDVHYRICVANENSKLTGTVIEVLGHYHPLQGHKLTIADERLKYWHSQGVQPTPKIRRLLWKSFSHS